MSHPAQEPISILRPTALSEKDIKALAAILIACVEGDASVSFMHPLSMERARAFWEDVATGLERRTRVVLLASIGGSLVGTVQLVFDLPENQPHRAEVAKLLVHPEVRGRGVGRVLMQHVEKVARDIKKTLLVLDTASPAAEKIYQALGWIRCGTIPGFALMPRGGLCATTIYYRPVAA